MNKKRGPKGYHIPPEMGPKIDFLHKSYVDITHQHSTHRSTQCTHLHSSFQRQSVFVSASRFLDHSETRTAFSFGSRKTVVSQAIKGNREAIEAKIRF